MSESEDQRAATIGRLSSIGEAAGLSDALANLAVDPATSLMKSRLILERILISILRFEDRQIPEKAMVGRLLRDDAIHRKVPPAVHAAMEYVNRVASAEGTHIGEARAVTARRALDHICDVLEWYSCEYLLSGLLDNFGDAVAESDALVVYVSTGGTCHCSMANVLTRHMGQVGRLPPQIRTMSAALNQPTRPTISEEAVEVIREELSVDASAHRTIRLDQRYIRRADLILAMDAKLLAQLPAVATRKAQLFAEFFGGAGNINDPWRRGVEAYRATFSELRRLISQGTANLDGLGNQRLHPTAAARRTS